MLPFADVRRSLRLRLRAPAVVSVRGARVDAIAEDVGVDGCRLSTPAPLRRGEAVYVAISAAARRPELAGTGTVVWSSAEPPYLVGVAFARAGAAERARFVRELLGRNPALARPPASLRPGQRLRLGPPPPPGTVLGRDELAVLRAARDGETVRALLEAAGPRHRRVRAALEALSARGLVHDGRAAPAAPGWLALLGTERAAAPPDPEPLGNPFAPRPRPLRALCFLEAARVEGAQGHLGASVEWLQHALAAAPEDREIADALEAITIGENTEEGGAPGRRPPPLPPPP